MDYSLKVGDLVRAWNPAAQEERTGTVSSINMGHVIDTVSCNFKSPKVDVIENVLDQIKKDEELEKEISNRPAAPINSLIAEQERDSDNRDETYSFVPKDRYMSTTVWVKLDPGPNATEPDYRQELPRPYGLNHVMKLEI